MLKGSGWFAPRPRRRSRGRASEWMALALTLLGGWGCSSYSDMLQRAQGYYDDNDYELALAVFRQLDGDQSALGAEERVRFYYLRGMTDYRLGYAVHARYWLGLARVSVREVRSALEEDELARLEATLSDLNRPLYGLPAPLEQEVVAPKVPIACSQNRDCGVGLLCVAGVCRPTEEGVAAELATGPTAGGEPPIAAEGEPATETIESEASAPGAPGGGTGGGGASGPSDAAPVDAAPSSSSTPGSSGSSPSPAGAP